MTRLIHEVTVRIQTKMWVMFKTILPVLLSCSVAVREASGTGWKPIPPPPGLFISKTPFPVRAAASDQAFAQDYRFEHLADEVSTVPRDEFRKHQKYDAFTTLEDAIYPKDSIKPYKSSVPVYESVRKRPTISYSSFNTFPGKKPNAYFDKPGIKYVKPSKFNYLNEYKYHKGVGFSDNEISPYHPFPGKGYDDRCPLYKVSFRQDLYFQYIQYKVHMPDLKEFTICLWSKFHNHSYDHPLFSYAVRHQPKSIYMWVSNTERSNYYNMKINGHPIFRLNYPIRLNRWYHTCQSWNAKTGEWQVWVNSQRIGRGFHNLLVGHVIPGGGIAISGQEQLQYGGGFLEAADLPKGSGGLLGEITMVQLYRIALSAGKAYTDHRHHHSHFTSTTPEPPEIPTEEPLPTPEHPFLENGQLKKPLKVFELAESLRTKGNLDTPQNQPSFADFFDGHFVNPYLSHAHRGHYSNAINIVPYAEHAIFKRHKSDSEDGNVKFVTRPAQVEKFSLNDDADDWSDKLDRVRRSLNETMFITVDEDASEPDEEDERAGRALHGRRRPSRKAVSRSRLTYQDARKHSTRRESQEVADQPKKIAKKHVILGDIHFRPIVGHEFGYLHNSLPILPLESFREGEAEKEKDDNPLHASGEEYIPPPQPEPAEDEVHRIMGVCSGCDRDPYRKVAVISWRSTPKKLFSGALFLRARPECRHF